MYDEPETQSIHRLSSTKKREHPSRPPPQRTVLSGGRTLPRRTAEPRGSALIGTKRRGWALSAPCCGSEPARLVSFPPSVDVVAQPFEAIAVARALHHTAHEELHRPNPVQRNLARGRAEGLSPDDRRYGARAGCSAPCPCRSSGGAGRAPPAARPNCDMKPPPPPYFRAGGGACEGAARPRARSEGRGCVAEARVSVRRASDAARPRSILFPRMRNGTSWSSSQLSSWSSSFFDSQKRSA